MSSIFPVNSLILAKLTFLVYIIDLFDLELTHVDMYPYLVAKNTISKKDKLKITATVSSPPRNPSAGHLHR